MVIFAKSLSRLRELKTVWREEKPGAREIWEKYLELRRELGADDRAIELRLQSWYADLPKAHPSKKWSRYKRVDSNGPWRDRDISWPGGGGPRYDVVHPNTRQACAVPERGWIYSDPAEMDRQIKLGLVEFRADHTEPPFRKAHLRPVPDAALDEVNFENDEEFLDEGVEDEEELASQVRGTYFYKQSQVSVKEIRALMGKKIFNNPKDTHEISRIVEYLTQGDDDAICMDFFAGSGTTGEAVLRVNARAESRKRWVLVQLPEPLDPSNRSQKLSANFCDSLGRPRTIAELTKERLRRAGAKIRADNPLFTGDTGFRVFKLDRSNVRAWDPDPADVETALFGHVDHVVQGRTELDVLYEILLKQGLDLCVPVETRTVARGAGGGRDSYSIHAVGGGVLFVCLSDGIDLKAAEAIASSIVSWRAELAPAADTRIIVKDAAFADDEAKVNLTAILAQHGLKDVRSI